MTRPNAVVKHSVYINCWHQVPSLLYSLIVSRPAWPFVRLSQMSPNNPPTQRGKQGLRVCLAITVGKKSVYLSLCVE